MFAKVHKPIDTPGASNKGSCIQLADYLEKENEGKTGPDRMQFFSHRYDEVSKGTVQRQIDANNRNLGKNDYKFYMVSINPSHAELQHLIQKTTGRKGVENFNELKKSEQAAVFSALRDYTREVMNIYAQNFNRPNVKTGADLLYFAKIETARKWHPWDRAVRDGLEVKGREKTGLNLHVHVIVSRNDVTQTTKLSPQSRSRGGKQLLNGKPVEQGFDHERFKKRTGELFNERFNYKPLRKEVYQKDRGAAPGLSADGVSAGIQKVTGKAKNKVKGVAQDALTQGHFETEKKIINTVKTAVAFVINPQAAATNLVKQKFLSIFKQGATAEL